MNTQALDEIIARMIPILPGDCKRSKAKKEWMRQGARERLIAWALAAGAIYYRLRIDPQPQTGGTVSGPILAVVGTGIPDRNEEIIDADGYREPNSIEKKQIPKWLKDNVNGYQDDPGTTT